MIATIITLIMASNEMYCFMSNDVQNGEIKGEDSLAIETSTVNFIAGGSVDLAKTSSSF